MNSILTPGHRRLIAQAADFHRANGRYPTYKESADALGLKNGTVACRWSEISYRTGKSRYDLIREWQSETRVEERPGGPWLVVEGSPAEIRKTIEETFPGGAQSSPGLVKAAQAEWSAGGGPEEELRLRRELWGDLARGVVTVEQALAVLDRLRA